MESIRQRLLPPGLQEKLRMVFTLPGFKYSIPPSRTGDGKNQKENHSYFCVEKAGDQRPLDAHREDSDKTQFQTSKVCSAIA